MSKIGKQAPYLDGVPVVVSTALRDAMFPSPDTNQRVQNLETGYVERYDGSVWQADVASERGGRVFNVQAYGAVGNDTPDSATGIQAAQDASNGEPTYFPPGRYRVSTELLFKAAQTKLDWQGAGADLVTVVLDDAAAFFAATSGNILRSEIADPIFTESASVTTIAQYADSVNVVSSAGVSVGDLLLVRPTDTATYGYGEIRKVRKIVSNTIYADAAYEKDYTAVGTLDIRVYPARFARVRGITFDLGSYAAGHAGISFDRLTYAEVSDCKFITGGQHGVYFLSTHTAIAERNEARDMSKRVVAWTPERSGESLITASRAELAGEGYGIAFEVYRGIARDNDFSRCRHAVSAGGGSYNCSHMLYEGNRSSEDLQGAYDMHSNVLHGMIRDNVAVRGWSGGWVRGKNISVTGNKFVDEAGDGVRIFETAENIAVHDNRMRRCDNGVRILVDDATALGGYKITENWFIDCISSGFANEPGQTLSNLEIKGNYSSGGKGNFVIAGAVTGLDILDNHWKAPFGYTAPGSDTCPIWIQADAGTPSIARVRIRGNTAELGAGDLSYMILLDKATGQANLPDNTYQDVTIVDNDLRTTGSSFNVLSIGNNGGGTESLVSGQFGRSNNRRNGSTTAAGGQDPKRRITTTATWDPGSLASAAVPVFTDVTLTGAQTGDMARVATATALPTGCFYSAHVTAANTVRIFLFNFSGGAQDIASSTYRVVVEQY